MAINKKHPDYPEYRKRCEMLGNRMFEEESKIPSPPIMFSDKQKKVEIQREFSRKLKSLQKEYAHLFE